MQYDEIVATLLDALEDEFARNPGLTEREMGERIGVGPQAINNWWHQRPPPGARSLPNIAKACGYELTLVKSEAAPVAEAAALLADVDADVRRDALDLLRRFVRAERQDRTTALFVLRNATGHASRAQQN